MRKTPKFLLSVRNQLNLLRHAFLFYSRIPIGKIDYSDQNLIKAFRYFPLVGIVVGGISALVYTLSDLILPQYISVLLGIIAGVIMTGALHEDGFSDFFDAFGGSHDKEKALEIMKDSHIGAYGVLSLIFLLLTKYTLLLSLSGQYIPWIFIASGASARLMPIITSKISTYARNENQKSKSLHLRIRIDNVTTTIATLFAGLPLLLLPWEVSAIVIPVYVLILFVMKWYTERRIGGYTGDTLGALEQFCEVAFYLSASVMLSIYP
ncbi:adenosylcobinamide-GDP ribazoletransferase [Porphyromonas sp.]|uniref:adenosylcobinamide-GDP ribazoletransferase n=1 Tax=Porphyromonas sp. TaxID=1924944 RepID=UPI0026DAAE0C|nr:adenosylcobinamide-GDP ribazoletransferase [Porphyromonas sp.]MDO4695175.1 adenosylcobinamide-GDP ribazoletransferase [Porphyromonas sp.]MDO4770921.1 adenosylcobinamide-GDP ribazoletransferase [Porphyromonas sp.]